MSIFRRTPNIKRKHFNVSTRSSLMKIWYLLYINSLYSYLMKTNCFTIILVVGLICIGKIGHAQTGYLQFVDSLQVILSDRYTFVEVEDLVFSNLTQLRVRRLINPEDESHLLQRGFDVNTDGLLNEHDGFEIIEQEKFTPWGVYLEMFPCRENQNVYLEVRGIDSTKQVLVIKKMLRLRDPLNTLTNCNNHLKIRLAPDQTMAIIKPTAIIKGKVYDRCLGFPQGDTIGLSTLTKLSIQPWNTSYPLKPRFDSTLTSITLDCRDGLTSSVIALAWNDTGPVAGCNSLIEFIDSTGICTTSAPSIRFKATLAQELFKSFTTFTPLFTAQEVIQPEPEQSKARSYMLRRSIGKNSIKQWIQLGYDRNGDGELSGLDGYDWNQDGDIEDAGEYFETKGSFLISPYLDTLPLVCSDFGDSLWIEVQANYARNVNRYESKWLAFSELPAYFGAVKESHASFLQLKPGKEPTGSADNGIGTVQVSDFLKSPFYTCITPDENTDKWGRNKLTRVSLARTRQIPDSTRKTITHECCEGQSNRMLIKLHLWDPLSPKPVAEFLSFITIEDTLNACFSFGCSGEPPSLGTLVQGTVNTWQGQTLKDYQVFANAYTASNSFALVNDQGIFSHYAQQLQNINYTYYIPQKDDDYGNGVSTFDLLKIQQHILGKQTFTSPYQFIAADVNRSGNVTTVDLIQLRKLILNIDSKFSNNMSWRFVDAAHIFAQPEDAISKYVPDRVLVKVPSSSTRRIDFIAIKIGDINGSVILK